jgi:uncharacterized OB-fold protein
MIAAVGLYEPAWELPGGPRTPGRDEDVTTFAVAAGRALLEARDPATSAEIGRIVVVTRRPDVLEGALGAVIALGIGIGGDVLVQWVVGGAPATADAIAQSAPGTIVIGVDTEAPAGAGAALVTGVGATVTATGYSGGHVPIRVRRTDELTSRDYGDARLERDRGWRPAIDALLGDGDGNGRAGAIVVGLPARDAGRLNSSQRVEQQGAAAPIFALARVASAEASAGPVRIVALDAGTGVGVTVRDGDRIAVTTERRAAMAADQQPLPPRDPAEIPVSLAAYDRAFEAKVGLRAARCECGQLSYPPRRICLSCGREDATVPAALPRTGEVYTGVTVHVPVPGMWGPYGLVIAALDETDVRLLAHVTDAPATAVGIGARGRLVLRRVAIREGVSDYGYGWQPEMETP